MKRQALFSCACTCPVRGCTSAVQRRTQVDAGPGPEDHPGPAGARQGARAAEACTRACGRSGGARRSNATRSRAVGCTGGVGRHARRRRDAPDADKARIEVYGQVMLDAIYDFKRMNPDWNATCGRRRFRSTARARPGCGKDGASIFSVRQSSLGFSELHTHRHGPDQDRPVLRPVRRRRLHADPLAEHLGRNGHVRRRPDLLELHGHRRVPEHHRLLGAERHGVRAQPAAALHALGEGRHERGVLAGGAELGARHRQDHANSTRSSATASPAGTGCPT